MQLIQSQNLTMSSREIAEVTGKRHDHVTRDIEKMLKELEKDAPSFGGIYLDAYNRPQTEYRLDRELADCLLTGYSAKMRMAVIKRWHELEAKQAPAIAIPDFSNPAAAARAWAEQYEQAQRVTVERDHAIATKAEIGSRREATAMATASAAKRQVKQLEEELGRNERHATIIAVERATSTKMASNAYVALRKWCKASGASAVEVVDPRFGTVKAWPAGAWLAIYGINLAEIF